MHKIHIFLFSFIFVAKNPKIFYTFKMFIPVSSYILCVFFFCALCVSSFFTLFSFIGFFFWIWCMYACDMNEKSYEKRNRIKIIFKFIFFFFLLFSSSFFFYLKVSRILLICLPFVVSFFYTYLYEI